MFSLNKSICLSTVLFLFAVCPIILCAQDSKKDPYIIHSKTAHVSSVDIKRKKATNNNIRIQVTNSNAGAAFSVTPSADTLNSVSWHTIPPPEITHIRVINGLYNTAEKSPENRRYTINTLYQVQFPFRVKIEVSDQNLEVEFTEAGNWSMNITLDNVYNPDLLALPANN